MPFHAILKRYDATSVCNHANEFAVMLPLFRVDGTRETRILAPNPEYFHSLDWWETRMTPELDRAVF